MPWNSKRDAGGKLQPHISAVTPNWTIFISEHMATGANLKEGGAQALISNRCYFSC